MAQVIAGDPEHRAWFYDTFAPRLYRRLRGRYAGNGGIDADDLLQDAFLLFLSDRSTVLQRFCDGVPLEDQTAVRLEGYLWGQVCGIASNRRRSLQRRPETALSTSFSPASEEDEERRTIDRDLLVRLTACLKRGGSRVFLYYKMRFVDGLTPEEVSTVTGWSRKATYKLKSSLNEAVARCARMLGIR